MTTVADVARQAGVSVASVSRTLAGHDGVSDDVRHRVLRAAELLQYRPNALARSLRTMRSHTLGLILSDVVNPFFGELASGAEEAAHERGFSVILCNANEDSARQDEYLELLLARRVDGLLLTPALTESAAVRSAVLEQRVPTVFVDRAVPGVPAPVVRADGRAATRALVEHLVGLGHDRIAIIAGPQVTLTGKERLTAFRTGMRAAGLPVPRELVRVGNFQLDSGRQATAQLLELAEPPSAIFAADNLMALGAIEQIRQHGLRIGRDIAVAGFDDPPWFRLLDPPMTTVSQPAAAIGRLAVQTLLDAIDGQPVDSHLLECELVVRASCGETGPHRRGPADMTHRPDRPQLRTAGRERGRTQSTSTEGAS